MFLLYSRSLFESITAMVQISYIKQQRIMEVMFFLNTEARQPAETGKFARERVAVSFLSLIQHQLQLLA